MASITVGLCGGLGNQMFQYAMGLSLSQRNNVPLVLDLYGFETDRHYRRKFGLDVFDIGEIATERHPFEFQFARALWFAARNRPAVERLLRGRYILEGSSEFREIVASLRIDRPVYAMGYWQDERYFATVRQKLREALVLRGGFSPANAEISKRMRDTNSVAVHCRRLHTARASANPKPVEGAERLGLALGQDYYQRSIELLSARLSSPHFFVFSDTPGWAEENLRSPFPVTHLQPGRGADHEDLLLMSQCRHHVIANSSFSWWGAWLASGDNQVVIAPKNVPYLPAIPPRWTEI
jgi:hypothetical protein